LTRPLLILATVTFSWGLGHGNDDPVAKPIAPDCAAWTLDGYHLGMLGTELLAVRSVTLHVEGQAQVIQPGKFRGALVLDALNRLKTWDAVYETPNGDGLRAELRERFGEPVSDVSGSATGDESTDLRQRRAIWLDRTCDAAIILYEDTSGRDGAQCTIHATLTRASSLRPGLVEMKTLFH
jgi:hypothetical protein